MLYMTQFLAVKQPQDAFAFLLRASLCFHFQCLDNVKRKNSISLRKLPLPSMHRFIGNMDSRVGEDTTDSEQVEWKICQTISMESQDNTLQAKTRLETTETKTHKNGSFKTHLVTHTSRLAGLGLHHWRLCQISCAQEK